MLNLQQIENRLRQQFCADQSMDWSVEAFGPSRRGNLFFSVTGMSAPYSYCGTEELVFDVEELEVMYRRRDGSFIIRGNRFYGSTSW